jgi:hypothetical protein
MSTNYDNSDDLLKKLTRDDFAVQVNTKFRFLQNSNWLEAELIEVTPLKTTTRQEQFSLFFQMPKEFLPVQGNYLFEHEKLGSTEIFIVPIEGTENDTIFQAVFNRILPK